MLAASGSPSDTLATIVVFTMAVAYSFGSRIKKMEQFIGCERSPKNHFHVIKSSWHVDRITVSRENQQQQDERVPIRPLQKTWTIFCLGWMNDHTITHTARFLWLSTSSSSRRYYWKIMVLTNWKKMFETLSLRDDSPPLSLDEEVWAQIWKWTPFNSRCSKSKSNFTFQCWPNSRRNGYNMIWAPSLITVCAGVKEADRLPDLGEGHAQTDGCYTTTTVDAVCSVKYSPSRLFGAWKQRA